MTLGTRWTMTLGTRWWTPSVAWTVAVVVGALVGGWVAGWIVGRKSTDPFSRYYLRRVAHFLTGAVAVVALAMVWRPFSGRIGLVLGLVAAGFAFAMQEVIGAWAGWLANLTGRVYRIGDRIDIGGVRGDVVDITPLRTKLLEIGEATPDNVGWVRGRQPTGRLVSVSNKKTFTESVFNYSAELDFIWEELTLSVGYDSDWERARVIMEEEAATASAETAPRALSAFRKRYPLRRADATARVFTRATDNYLELAARFPVSVRIARPVKDELTRRVLERFRGEGIPIASTSQDISLSIDDPGRMTTERRSGR